MDRISSYNFKPLLGQEHKTKVRRLQHNEHPSKILEVFNIIIIKVTRFTITSRQNKATILCRDIPLFDSHLNFNLSTPTSQVKTNNKQTINMKKKSDHQMVIARLVCL